MKYWYIILGISLMVFTFNQVVSSEFFEQFYQNGFYQFIRAFYRHTFYHLPFGLIYIGFPVVLIGFLLALRKTFMLIKSKSYQKAIIPLASFFLVMYASFYILWGFNYKVENLESRLKLPRLNLDTTMVIHEIQRILPLLEDYRTRVSKDSSKLDIGHRPADIETVIRRSQSQLLQSWGIPSKNGIRVRKLKPNGMLLVFSTAGIYIPYVFEGHYDGGLSHIQSAYVIAHEMAHGYGITSEADCNFVALLTCLESENDYLRYTGLLTYWRYLMSDLRDKAPYSFYYLAYHRPLGLRNDIKEIYRCLDRYPDVLPELRDLFYDSYLKANGVTEGLQSYNRVVDLYLSWQNLQHQ